MQTAEGKNNLGFTVIEVTADTMKAVSMSYSADRIAEKSPVRKSFKHNGKFYISSGSVVEAVKDPRRTETAYQIVPRSEFKGTPHWYGERIRPCGRLEGWEEREEWAAQRRALPEGFYHGMLIKHGGAKLREIAPDFANAVAPTYESMNWQWSPGRTAPHVPDVKEIEETLYECIDGLSEKYVTNGSGGLEAFYEMPSEGESGNYGLRFVFSNTVFFD